MDDLIVWISGWDAAGNKKLAEQLSLWGGIPHVHTHCDFSKHEPENYNICILESIQAGFKYILFADSDVEFIHQETIPKMYESITGNRYPKMGSIRPWRKGEEAQPSFGLEEKYVDDNTAMMFRLDMGVWFDEEFLFTGWSDYDVGLEIEYKGWKNYSDRRYPVKHYMDRSNAHSKSTCLLALKKRNKLILDYKWWMCGRDKWCGIELFNETLPLERRVPTMQQIVAMSDENQHLFSESVSPEHHNIWVKDGHEDPNLVWENPIIVGYNTRERFEREHGYS